MRVILINLYKEIGNDIESLQKDLLLVKAASVGLHDEYLKTINDQSKIWDAFDVLCEEFFDNPESVKPLKAIILKHREVSTKKKFKISNKKKILAAEEPVYKKYLFYGLLVLWVAVCLFTVF